MIEYDGSKCEPHGQTRCITCMALAAKGKKPVVKSAPPEITGMPPADIEGLGNVRDRVTEPVTEEITDYDRIIAEMSQKQAPAEDNPTIPSGAHVVRTEPRPVDPFSHDTFAALPTDDSHASKVVRAAAEFASASQSWAQELAYVEKVKQILLTAESVLDRVTKEKDKAEQELKALVVGE